MTAVLMNWYCPKCDRFRPAQEVIGTTEGAATCSHCKTVVERAEVPLIPLLATHRLTNQAPEIRIVR